jgi:ABC-type transporter Mla subunit MlaD
MSAKTNHFKLGLFVTAGLVVGLGALLWLGGSALYQQKQRMHAVFDESVNGLDVGSPVKYRGVTLGNVANIRFATDQQTVIVDMDIYADSITAAGLRQGERMNFDFGVQLTSAGITGGKYIAADEFPEDRYPRVKVPEHLPDDVLTENLLPSVTSSLKNFEETVYTLAEALPEMFSDVDALVAELLALSETANDLATGEIRDVLERMAENLADVDVDGISDGLVETLEELPSAIASLREGGEHLLAEDGKVYEILDEIQELVTSADQALADADVPGVRSEVRNALGAAGDLAGETGALTRDARLLTDDLRLTVADLRQALEALTRVLDLIEREPSSPLRGRDAPQVAPRTN